MLLCESSPVGYSHSLVKIAWLCAIIGLTGCRVHTLVDGVYTLVPQEVLHNDCGLSVSDVFGSATLRTEGNLVALTLAPLDLGLVGTYREGVEEMTLDGSLSNYATVLNGRQCLLDTVTFHFDAETLGSTSFEGAMSISYEARQPDECGCRLWVKLAAWRQ